jgi:hypothetical protein
MIPLRTYVPRGPGSVVGIATGYGLDGPEIKSRWGEIFRTCPDRPWGPPSTCTMGTGSFPEVKSCRGVTLTLHPLLVPWSRKSRAITLLPLWAVRPVQSLSACTRVHFTYIPHTQYASWTSRVTAVWVWVCEQDAVQRGYSHILAKLRKITMTVKVCKKGAQTEKHTDCLYDVDLNTDAVAWIIRAVLISSF